MKRSTLNRLHEEQEALKASGVCFCSPQMRDDLSDELKVELRNIPFEFVTYGAADVEYHLKRYNMAIIEDELKSY